ncbi:uncharacterized protein DSM5745_05121 [Aspergillus mulundensis]|uniref:Uncharacterized protein n=1 Tax=Aspergillus mulundensis TaxID=1810919 RepID=A0A3D8S6C9_9EURO|nr:hypothetical protein DSM5745_05121 [Aspergillus mulundensis]RDW81564.1 hypothetical protein DSM5745_05121 [Aspergillus mulundensis]
MSRSKDSPDSSSSAISTPQLFALAHPPPKSSKASKSKSPRLRLSSRLLLQIQQSSPGRSRAIPILELYQPSTFGKTISTPGAENGHGSHKVHGRDLYLTMSEMYTHLKRERDGPVKVTKPRSGSGGSTSTTGASSFRKSKSSAGGDSSADEGTGECKAIRPRSSHNNGEREKESEQDDVVAVIHTSPSPPPKPATTAPAPADAALFFPLTNQTWTATAHGSGHYRFVCETSAIIFEWEKRPPSRSGSAAAAAEKAAGDEGDRFALSVSVSDATSPAKRPWLAQLTKRGIRVGGLEAWRDEPGVRALMGGGDGAGLYTLILTMGVWVARGEGWVN